jgi:hypothetical protein
MIVVRPALASAILLAGLCGGCASDRTPGSEALKEGYFHGCRSGFSDAGREGYENKYVKDIQRYASDAEYRSGWDKGHNACYEEERRAPRMIFNGDSV